MIHKKANGNHTLSETDSSYVAPYDNLIGREIANFTTVNDSFGNPAIYIFNFAGNEGWMVFSAEFEQEPVLAFSETGNMVEGVVPSALIDWFEKTVDDILVLRLGFYDNSEFAEGAWNNLYWRNDLSDWADYMPRKGGGSGDPYTTPPTPGCAWISFVQKGPLLPVTWGQQCGYNDFCPVMSCGFCANQRALTGCVATAMSQVIRYWQSPSRFNYASMPSAGGNSDVAALMIDAGISVNMSYGCSRSSASFSDAKDAFHYSFGYVTPTINQYNSGSNILMIENEINANRPVIFSGCNDQSTSWLFFTKYDNCHAWVCDGFISSSNCTKSSVLYHMNWGWHETNGSQDYNGWFLHDNWNITALNRNYRYAADVMVNIHP